jgi:hypothetical protein
VPAFLFHQNMRTFSASPNSDRQNAYQGLVVPPPPCWPVPPPAAGSYGFPAINAGLPAAPLVPGPGQQVHPQICIAGLTEIRSSNALPGAGVLTRILTGPGRIYMFFAGRTASNIEEFATIGIANWIPVLALGRVVVAGGETTQEVTAAANVPPNWLLRDPARGSSLDYRWVVYALVRISPGGPPVAVGFIHNTYTLESRYTVAQRMPWIVSAIRENPVAPTDHVYIGGDFNVAPHPARDRGETYPYAAIAAGPGFFGAAGAVAGCQAAMPGGTTWSGRLFDYWLSSVNPAAPRPPVVLGGINTPVASVHTGTWDGPRGLMSDHVASLLQIV